MHHFVKQIELFKHQLFVFTFHTKIASGDTFEDQYHIQLILFKFITVLALFNSTRILGLLLLQKLNLSQYAQKKPKE